MRKTREILCVPDNSELPFSTVVGFENICFVSGMVGRHPTSGNIAVGNIYDQTRQTMKNLAGQLEKAGLTMDHVLKTTVFITDMSFFSEMNRAYVEFFRNGLPARSCVQVAALPDPEALVEVEAIAHR